MVKVLPSQTLEYEKIEKIKNNIHILEFSSLTFMKRFIAVHVEADHMYSYLRIRRDIPAFAQK
jgi:hypothetical protein